jgi:TPR repeat protein
MEAAAMDGYDVERCNLGTMEAQSGNMGRAVKHWTIAASTGNHAAMQNVKIAFNQGHGVSRDALNSTLIAYNNYCDEMRSVARDTAIREHIEKGCAPYSSISQPDEAWRNRQKSKMN